MTDRKDEERKTPSWQLPQERQPETDAYHIWTPRPLLRSIYWKPDPAPPFETISSTYEIFVDQRAWLTMHEHVWQAPAGKTPFGYLIGDLCEDPNANRRFVSITAALPARFDFDEHGTEQISREATLALQLEVERRRGVLAGWYHRHLGGEIRLSEEDVATHHEHFGQPWQCAFVFVAGDDRCAGGCFRSTPDAFAGDLLLPFYEMASNESLLARGVKRSYVDWTNYTTVDEIRSEPKPRPSIAIPKPAEPPAAAPPPPAPKPTREPTPERKPEPEPPREPEPKSRPEPGPPKSRPEPTAPEPTAPEPTAGDRGLDFDALIDEVKTARIEFDDGEDEPPAPAEPPKAKAETEKRPKAKAEKEKEKPKAREKPAAAAPAPAPPTPDVPAPKQPSASEAAIAAAGLEPDPDAPKAPARKPSRATPGGERAKMIGLVALALVLLAAIGWGVTSFLSDRSGPAPARAGAETATPAEGGADAGPAAGGPAGAAADSVAPVTAAALDSAGRDMLSTISRFYGRAVARDNGEATCEDLQEAYVAVENQWIRYNTEFKGRFDGELPPALQTRDDRLYAGIQDAEMEYDRSGCPRP